MDYVKLAKEIGQIKNSSEEVNGIDAFLQDRVKLSSMDDLLNFVRISNDTLVHKAEKDLWRVGENESGDIVVERLFDPSTNKALRI